LPRTRKAAPVITKSMQTIACLNKATQHFGVDFERLIAVLQTFLDDCFAPVWGRWAQLVKAEKELSDAWTIIFFDDADQAKKLGYQEISHHGLPLAKVFVKSSQEQGKKVSVAASHQLAETLIDPAVNMWCDGPGNTLWAYEVCDAVEEDEFAIDGIQLSNFVLPDYFRPKKKEVSSKYDYLGYLRSPFSLRPGGYSRIRQGRRVSNKFGSAAKASRFAKEDRRLHRSEYRGGPNAELELPPEILWPQTGRVLYHAGQVLHHGAQTVGGRTVVRDLESGAIVPHTGHLPGGNLMQWIDFSATLRNLEGESKRTVDLLFATDRQYKTVSGSIAFSGEREDDLTYGSLTVNVPEDHKIGKLELPKPASWIRLRFFDEPEGPKRHFTITNIEISNRESFWDTIKRDSRGSALIFVHGFNTSFKDGALRLAQITWDLQYMGVPILFSWPSRGAVSEYFYDFGSALNSRKFFKNIVRDLRRKAKIKTLHIIAHSMGNLIVLESLRELADLKRFPKISELIMAAPDVDIDLYKGMV